MKSKRHVKILELIEKNNIETQEELSEHLREKKANLEEKYIRVFKEGCVSMDMAQNILVIKTVSGMAMAVAASLDAIGYSEIVGSIAGDDTIMCAVRSVEDTERVMEKLRRLLVG